MTEEVVTVGDAGEESLGGGGLDSTYREGVGCRPRQVEAGNRPRSEEQWWDEEYAAAQGEQPTGGRP